uniref:LRRK2 beta-propeller domain-containing protein n=1 Tax=Timema shepardi TaxID=629360 RepID=A0A7R9ANV0_TIMSH|nr:unnamed protein product [Timema shepardi]
MRGCDCRPLFSYVMDPEAPEQSSVCSLLPLVSLQRVAVGLSNGRLFLVRSDMLPISPTMGEGSFVMTELGSCIVYQWDPISRTILNKLDCSKLVPCSESLKSISIEEHLSPGKCQVTSLAMLNNELYIGTTWGCIVVAERSSMRPITVFRPFEEEVRMIVPLPRLNHEDEKKSNYPLVATIGRGYRTLIARYTDTVITPSVLSPQAFDRDRGRNMYALLWHAGQWAAA